MELKRSMRVQDCAALFVAGKYDPDPVELGNIIGALFQRAPKKPAPEAYQWRANNWLASYRPFPSPVMAGHRAGHCTCSLHSRWVKLTRLTYRERILQSLVDNKVVDAVIL